MSVASQVLYQIPRYFVFVALAAWLLVFVGLVRSLYVAVPAAERE